MSKYADDDFFRIDIRVHHETLEAALMKRIEGLKKSAVDDKVKKRAAEIYLDCIEPLVPMKSGNLRASARVPDDKYKGDYYVLYGNDLPAIGADGKKNKDAVNYAQAQFKGYNGRGASRNFTTPGTYDHWNKHMSRADRQAFYDLVAEEIVENMKHGQK